MRPLSEVRSDVARRAGHQDFASEVFAVSQRTGGRGGEGVCHSTRGRKRCTARDLHLSNVCSIDFTVRPATSQFNRDLYSQNELTARCWYDFGSRINISIRPLIAL